MIKKLLIATQLILVSAGAQTKESETAATDWSSQKPVLSSLNTWGTRNYKFSAREPGGKEATIMGSMILSTEVKPDAVILRDNFQIVYKGEKLSLEMTYTCKKDPFLSPSRIESKGTGSDEFGTFVATVSEGVATIRSEDIRKKTCKIPEGTITTAAMMRLVTLVPRTPGMSFSYKHSLEAEELNLKDNYRLQVLQPESITSCEKQVKCTKFKLTGGGIHPVFYWVSDDGVLRRVLIDDRKVMDLQK